jgi:hypothetical protein
MSFHQKDKLRSFFASIYHKQFGHNTLIEYLLAISFISFSQSIFPVSLNQADIIITLFIHFSQHSFNAFNTNFAGITITAISTTIGSSHIEFKNIIFSKLHHFGFTQNFSHLNFLKFISKSFHIFHHCSEAHIIANEFISKKSVFIFCKNYKLKYLLSYIYIFKMSF